MQNDTEINRICYLLFTQLKRFFYLYFVILSLSSTIVFHLRGTEIASSGEDGLS